MLILLLLQSRKLLLSFTAFSRRNPSALNVRLTLKPSTLAAGSASEVLTIFLRLVPTVLTVHSAATYAAATGPHHGEPEPVRLIRERHRNFVVNVVVGGAIVVVSATRAHTEGVEVGQVLVVVVRGLWPYLESLVVDLFANVVSEQELTVIITTGVVNVLFSLIFFLFRLVLPSCS